MTRFVIAMLLGLAACAASEPGQPPTPVDLQAWRLATGKAPTRAEYAAVAAACQDRPAAAGQSNPFDACLADLGLSRAADR
jgi:hypothetical protein